MTVPEGQESARKPTCSEANGPTSFSCSDQETEGARRASIKETRTASLPGCSGQIDRLKHGEKGSGSPAEHEAGSGGRHSLQRIGRQYESLLWKEVQLVAVFIDSDSEEHPEYDALLGLVESLRKLIYSISLEACLGIDLPDSMFDGVFVLDKGDEGNSVLWSGMLCLRGREAELLVQILRCFESINGFGVCASSDPEEVEECHREIQEVLADLVNDPTDRVIFLSDVLGEE